VEAATVAEIGQHLRSAREARGLSVADVARGTHIRPAYITALEDDRLEELPAPVYARGFLRNYATFLGLDAEDLVAAYERSQSPERKRKRNRGGPVVAGPVWRGPRPRALTGAAALVVLAAFVGYLFHQYSEFAATRPEAVFAPTPSPTPLAPLPVVVVPTVTPIPTLAPSPTAIPSPTAGPAPTSAPAVVTAPTAVATRAAPTPSPKPTATPDKVLLSMKFVRECWLRVTVDGKVVFEGTLQPGVSRSWDGARFITVRVGNAGGVNVTVNGQDLGVLGAPGEVVEKTYHL
jgi:cytoskeletal protein RodZ